MRGIVTQLEKFGFEMPFTERLGPCEDCGSTTATYWLPEERIWQCEECVYQ